MVAEVVVHQAVVAAEGVVVEEACAAHPGVEGASVVVAALAEAAASVVDGVHQEDGALAADGAEAVGGVHNLYVGQSAVVRLFAFLCFPSYMCTLLCRGSKSIDETVGLQ